MPIYKQNTKVGEVIDTLKDVGTRYHDKLVFQHKFAVGAVLWQGPAAFVDDFNHVNANGQTSVTQDSRVLINQNITLPKSIKLLRNGLTVNIDPEHGTLGGSFSWMGTNTMEVGSLSATSIGAKVVNTHVTLAQLQARTPVAIVEETTWTVYCQAVDDTHIKFYAVNASGSTVFETEQNSTKIHQFDSSGSPITWYARYLVLIQSITAY